MEHKQKRGGYRHFVQGDRDRIEALLDLRIIQKEIAKILEVSPPSVSREIARNRRRRTSEGKPLPIPGPYEASLAEHKAYVRRKYAKYEGKKISENKELKTYIIEKMEGGWTPDVISGSMKREKKPFYASKTAIYEWLAKTAEGDRYQRLLPKGRKGYKKGREKHVGIGHIPNRVSIHERPDVGYGGWEGDTMVSGKRTGGKTALAVICEKKTKYVSLRKILSLSPRLVREAVNDMMDEVRGETLTLDNGLEMREHETMNILTFFCDAYASWQKGGVENAIGLIRRYIPKGADISLVSEDEIITITERLNHTPRKSLGYKTPYEVMVENNMFKQKNAVTAIALRG